MWGPTIDWVEIQKQLHAANHVPDKSNVHGEYAIDFRTRMDEMFTQVYRKIDYERSRVGTDNKANK